MLAHPTDIVNSFGYLGIFLLIFVFPVPQELVLPLAGFISAQGKLNVVFVVLSGVAGSTLGSLPWYWAGQYLGEERLMAWAEQSRWIKLSTHDVQHSKKWFDRAGRKAVLLSQFIPIIRTLIAVPAGVSRMNLGLFLLCLISSAIVWQGSLACAGYLLGSQYHVINHYGSLLRSSVVVLIAFAVLWYIRRKR
jgi:membrane protein DedA with SNARE-associated domain